MYYDYEYTRYEIKEPIIKKANQYLKEMGLAGYDTEFINDIRSIEYLYDIDLNKIPSILLNDTLFDKEVKYYISNAEVSENKYFLTETEALRLAQNIIKDYINTVHEMVE